MSMKIIKTAVLCFLSVALILSSTFCFTIATGTTAVEEKVLRKEQKELETTAAAETTAAPEETAAPETTAPETTAEPETTAPETTAEETWWEETWSSANYSEYNDGGWETYQYVEETNPPETEPPYEPIPFTPQPLVGAVPESGRVDPSYFNDCVFIGDSVSLKLKMYCAGTGALGGAQFLTAGSLGSANALWEVSDQSVHPYYNGIKMKLEQSVPQTGAKKMYVMLGMNDIGYYGIDTAIANLTTLIDKIQATAGGIHVYIQSMTPIAQSSTLLNPNGLCPANIQAYNQRLLALCQSRGWSFVDVASVMYNENGYLKDSYCSDLNSMGIHFTNDGCAAWVEYLLTHTAG